jgi:hypothetical protein
LVPPKRIGNHDIAAAHIDVSPKTLAVVQQFSAERSSASKIGKTSKPGAEGYIEGRNRPDDDDNFQRPARGALIWTATTPPKVEEISLGQRLSAHGKRHFEIPAASLPREATRRPSPSQESCKQPTNRALLDRRSCEWLARRDGGTH